MTVRPYPWPKLPRVTRSSVEALRQARTLVAPGSLACRAVAALGGLVSETIAVEVSSAGDALTSTHASQVLSLRLDGAPRADGAAVPWTILDVELPFALAVVALATKRSPPSAVYASAASPALLGAFAGLVAAACRRAGAPVVVRPAAPGEALEGRPEEMRVAAVEVRLLGESTRARAFFPPSVAERAPSPFARPQLVAMGATRLGVPVVGCRALASMIDVAALGPGDIWCPGDAWQLGLVAKGLRGKVWLAAPAGERAALAELEDGGRIVLRTGAEELGWSPVSDVPNESDALVEAVGDVPVVVRVELGVAHLSAKEWSALAPGDVISLGAKVGSAVTLRVSSLAVAEGELVDVDGEVGVRIQRRLLDP